MGEAATKEDQMDRRFRFVLVTVACDTKWQNQSRVSSIIHAMKTYFNNVLQDFFLVGK